MEINEIGAEIKINDRLFNDAETETDRWYVSIAFCGNGRRYKNNGDICSAIRQVKENVTALETYSISKELYDMTKEKIREYYTLPLTQKHYPELSHSELLKSGASILALTLSV